MEMPVVELTPIFHREMECIGIYFKHSAKINTLIRQHVNARWSNTKKLWYIPLDRECCNKLLLTLKDVARVEKSGLRQYLVNRKNNIRVLVPERKTIEGAATIAPPPPNVFSRGSKPALLKIQPVNAHVLRDMEEHLKLKAYSAATIRTYLNEMSQLLQALKNIPADQLNSRHLKRYLLYCYEKLGLTENTLHSRMNAMKFYYEQVLKKEKFFWEIPRPKKQLQLPRFFNQNEVAAIIKAAGTIKHKVMLMLAYASGLRVSEVTAIKINDIDSSRMCILIRQAKGKKDRMVALSPVLLVMLREYWKTGGLVRNGYLFPGQYAGEPYSSRSVQMVLAAAKKKAGVMKPGSVHALRHSFATHLLDKGTDVTMIQKLLGHNDIKTTLRYLHVTNRDMLQVMSPLDDLKL